MEEYWVLNPDGEKLTGLISGVTITLAPASEGVKPSISRHRYVEVATHIGEFNTDDEARSAFHYLVEGLNPIKL